MRDLLPYSGLTPDVERALAALETAERFEDVRDAYGIVRAEADRRAPLMLGLVVPAALVGAALIWLIQRLGWLPANAPWAYAFGPILFAALVLWPVRGNAARDDSRIGKALAKWKAQAKAEAKP